ncbi:hypothetical protein B0B51_03320 [blood disease bacterium A2-HR MARDI]|uniref:Lipoprotein n=1 Tax=blood disease bacterium A2-HR MARDI TaxID=1944648 RepID=A0A1U9VEP0_9RALS|nr:hypothetical protein B0B51_03320 [blood disease bacterium A2-HR MARDI]
MKTLLLVLCLMLTACCTTNGAKTDPQVIYQTKLVDTACEWTKPIYVDKADVMSEETARAILAHNRAGAKVCGWKPLK